ncbi:MAG: type II toxin-antitoxin system Phd/YefM family antitoxin, partial [Thermodesulfobacteriota bacterium]
TTDKPLIFLGEDGKTMKIASVFDVKTHFNKFLKASKHGLIIVTQNGKPAGVLLSVEDEDEIERLALAYSPKFQKMLELARQQIREGRGIRNRDFWKDIEDKEG